MRLARLEQQVQRLAFAQQVALADYVRHAMRAHRFGQRRGGLRGEQVSGHVLSRR